MVFGEKATHPPMLTEMWPPKSKFSVDDIPDLTGKVAIVTGGNTGIGKVTCKYLLVHNAKVYLACRSREKAEAAIKDLKVWTGKDAYFLQCDLADLPSVKRAAQEYQSMESSLHMLFNSAGVMAVPIDQVTAQGYDMQFGTNVIGHSYFTMLLLPTLISTAKRTPPGTVRIINTSSNAHSLVAPKGGINYATIKDGPERRKMSSFALYGQSKWGNVVFAKELARRYGDLGIVTTSLNPGGIKTELQRHTGTFTQALLNLMLHPADPLGAITQLYAGTAPEAAKINGKYLYPWARVGEARRDALDPAAWTKLWEFIERETRDY